MLVTLDAAARILQQATASNIHSGTSKIRQGWTSSKLQRATARPRFTSVACTVTLRLCQGCQG